MYEIRLKGQIGTLLGSLNGPRFHGDEAGRRRCGGLMSGNEVMRREMVEEVKNTFNILRVVHRARASVGSACASKGQIRGKMN